MGLLWCVFRFLKEYGFFFSFFVDACVFLKEYIYIEGFFRKSGFVVRLKVLKVGIVLNYIFLVVLFFDLIFIIGIFF